jgi:transposase InsO family protein
LVASTKAHSVKRSCSTCPSAKRRPTVRLAREHPRPAAKTLSLVGGRATAIFRQAALHGHTGFARRTGSGRQSRTGVYGERFSSQARLLDIREAVIAPRSPWQNAYAERVIGSIRRECLDHVVVIGERHLLGILSKYVDYYNGNRTHLSLGKDAPERPSRGVSSRRFREGRGGATRRWAPSRILAAAA